jgi:hypothetical protein
MGTSGDGGAGDAGPVLHREGGWILAYDCANSLVEPVACPTPTPHHAMDRMIFGEIVQIKSKRRVPVFRCKVVETDTSQKWGGIPVSWGEVTWYLKFWEPRRWRRWIATSPR